MLEVPAEELEARARAEERRWLERLLADGAGEPGRLCWLPQETCPRLLAAYRTGRYFSVALAAEGTGPVTEMAMMLRDCGETAEAERLLATVLPSFHPESMPEASPAQRVAEIRRRLEREPRDPVLHRALADASRELPAEEWTAILERWAEQVPGDAEPALRLAAFEEERARRRGFVRVAPRYVEATAQRERWDRSSAARRLAGPCAAASRGLRPSSLGSEVDLTALTAARSRCPESLSDGELAFPDDELLGLTAKLTHVG